MAAGRIIGRAALAAPQRKVVKRNYLFRKKLGKKKGRRNTKFFTILIFSDKFSSKITTKSQLSDMARMHAPRDPFSKGDDEGHDKPKFSCNLAKDESVSFTRFKFKELV